MPTCGRFCCRVLNLTVFYLTVSLVKTDDMCNKVSNLADVRPKQLVQEEASLEEVLRAV